jgi:hypothetical protein
MQPEPQSVRPPVALLTEEDARELLSKPLRALCQEHGPTRVAKALGGVDEKTVRNARDEKSTLCLDTAANLLSLDGTALDGFLGHFGRRSVPIGSICTSDPLPAMTGAVHKLVTAASPASPGGAALSRDELLDARHDIRSAFDALGALLHRIDELERGVG